MKEDHRKRNVMKIWRFSSFFDKESFVVEYVPLKIEIAYFFSEGGILYSERKEKQSDRRYLYEIYI